jgi:5-methylthioadenosine/S-adenosylhomocysteine deaminase
MDGDAHRYIYQSGHSGEDSVSKYLIKDVVAVTMNDDADIIGRADILVVDDLIEGIGSRGSLNDEGAEAIDGRNKIALPGLVNAHAHSAMTLLRGYADDLPLQEWLEKKIWPRESFIKEGDVYDGTMLAAAEMIKGGTTCFADMYFHSGEVSQAAEDSGLRASVCEVLLSFKESVHDDLRNAVQLIVDLRERNGRVTGVFGPHSLYACDLELLKLVAEWASELKTGIHLHLLETRTERDEIVELNKEQPFEILKETGLLGLPLLAAHSVYLTDEETDLAAASPYSAVHTPGSNLKLASGIAPVWDFMQHDIDLALGTDGAASNNNLDMFEEIRLAALIHKIETFDATTVSAYQALYMATRGGAQAVGLGGKIGRLATGYKADIILVDTEKPHLTPQHNVVANLVYSAGAADVSDTMVDGRWLMRNRMLESMDETAVLKKGRETAADLVQRK